MARKPLNQGPEDLVGSPSPHHNQRESISKLYGGKQFGSRNAGISGREKLQQPNSRIHDREKIDRSADNRDDSIIDPCLGSLGIILDIPLQHRQEKK